MALNWASHLPAMSNHIELIVCIISPKVCVCVLAGFHPQVEPQSQGWIMACQEFFFSYSFMWVEYESPPLFSPSPFFNAGKVRPSEAESIV